MTLLEVGVVGPKDDEPELNTFNSFRDMNVYYPSLYEMMSADYKRQKKESLISPNKLVNAIANGFRPEIPHYIPVYIREVIESCWNHDPDERPSFKRIVQLLNAKGSTGSTLGIEARFKSNKQPPSLG